MRRCMYVTRVLYIVILLLGLYSRAYTQQIATVGVIDIAKLYAAFPKESGGYGDLEQLKKKYQTEIDKEIDELELLKRKKVLALKNKNYKLADSLDKEINRMADYITSLSSRRQGDLIRRSKSPVAKKILTDIAKCHCSCCRRKRIHTHFQEQHRWTTMVGSYCRYYRRCYKTYSREINLNVNMCYLQCR